MAWEKYQGHVYSYVVSPKNRNSALQLRPSASTLILISAEEGGLSRYCMVMAMVILILIGPSISSLTVAVSLKHQAGRSRTATSISTLPSQSFTNLLPPPPPQHLIWLYSSLLSEFILFSDIHTFISSL